MFLTKPWNEIKKLLGIAEKAEEEALEFSIETIDAIAKFDTANPEVADIITTLIPGTADDAMKVAARAALPKILVDMRLVQATQSLTDPNEIILSGINTLKTIEGDTHSAFLHSISVLLARAISPETPWSKMIIAIESLFDSTHK